MQNFITDGQVIPLKMRYKKLLQKYRSGQNTEYKDILAEPTRKLTMSAKII